MSCNPYIVGMFGKRVAPKPAMRKEFGALRSLSLTNARTSGVGGYIADAGRTGFHGLVTLQTSPKAAAKRASRVQWLCDAVNAAIMAMKRTKKLGNSER